MTPLIQALRDEVDEISRLERSGDPGKFWRFQATPPAFMQMHRDCARLAYGWEPALSNITARFYGFRVEASEFLDGYAIQAVPVEEFASVYTRMPTGTRIVVLRTPRPVVLTPPCARGLETGIVWGETEGETLMGENRAQADRDSDVGDDFGISPEQHERLKDIFHRRLASNARLDRIAALKRDLRELRERG